jgi:hypothetical protein
VLAALACGRMSAVSLTDVRSKRLALSVVLPGWKGWGLRMRAARADWEDRQRRKVVKKILPKRRVNRAAFRRAWGQVG